MKHMKKAVIIVITLLALCMNGCPSPDNGNPGYSVDTTIARNITLSENVKYLFSGNEFLLMAVVTPTTALNQDITWKTDNPSVATVIGTGSTVTVRGVSDGTTLISANTEGGVFAVCEVNVSSIPVELESIILGNDSLFLVVTEAPFILRASLIPWHANIGNDLTWTAEPEGYVSIEAGDNIMSRGIRAVAPGHTTIKVEGDTGIFAVCEVEVVAEDLRANYENLSLMEGHTSQIQAQFRPYPVYLGGVGLGSGGAQWSQTLYSQVNEVIWESENEAVATVARTGSSGTSSFNARVTGVAAGNTRIKMTAVIGERNLVAYTAVKVSPVWNIDGDWFFEDFEDFQFNRNVEDIETADAEVRRPHPLNRRSGISSSNWSILPGTSSNPGASMGQDGYLESAVMAVPLTDGPNKIARYR